MEEEFRLEPLTGKKLNVIIVEKEYEEPWWLLERGVKELKPQRSPIKKPSLAFCEFLKKMVSEYSPDFATEELGMRSRDKFYKENPVAKVFEESKVPFYPVDMDEKAKSYLASTLQERENFKNSLIEEISKLHSQKVNAETQKKIDYLTAYAQYLDEEIEEKEREISFDVREKWIVKGILDYANSITKDTVTCIHISSPSHVEGLTSLLKTLNAWNVTPLKVEKKVQFSEASTGKIPNSIEIEVKPTVKREILVTKIPRILIFLDTDEPASPFDICQSYDAGFDVIIPYSKVDAEMAKRIVQDAMFSRGEKNVKYTCYFLGGSDFGKVKAILETVKKTMFPPFESPVIVDPRGAYTTAAAMVALTEEGWGKVAKEEVKKRKVVVLAGTGPVGRAAAILYAKLGCDVYLTSRSLERAESVAKEVSEEAKTEIKGVKASSPEEVYEVVKDAHIILATGAAGVMLMPKTVVEKLKGVKVVADVNAVPPPGVEGLKPKFNLKEFAPSIYGIGALAVGQLKNRVEREILSAARTAGKGIFDYNYAFTAAQKLLREKTFPTIKMRYS